MRYALISDIHGNLPALEAVLRNISKKSDVAATYHLGDLVGYGPSSGSLAVFRSGSTSGRWADIVPVRP